MLVYELVDGVVLSVRGHRDCPSLPLRAVWARPVVEGPDNLVELDVDGVPDVRDGYLHLSLWEPRRELCYPG